MNADAHDIADSLVPAVRRIDDHRIQPAVSAISGTMAPPRAASVRLMVKAVAVDPVMATPASAGCANAILTKHSARRGTSCTTSAARPIRAVIE